MIVVPSSRLRAVCLRPIQGIYRNMRISRESHSMQNPYCDALGIAVPSVQKAARSRDACSYSLLIAVLLERGGPVTLEQAAQRIAAATGDDAKDVLASLKRCKPARPPIYRNGDLYELDPHDDEADLWAFRLGLSRPLGDKATLLAYLQGMQTTRFRRRLEADAKALFALYQYGRLHGCVRLHWGFIDETLPAPWVNRDERTLYDLMQCSNERGVPLKVVVGSAPGWEDPWSRARPACVKKDEGGWRYQLFDMDGNWIDELDVQAARLSIFSVQRSAPPDKKNNK